MSAIVSGEASSALAWSSGSSSASISIRMSSRTAYSTAWSRMSEGGCSTSHARNLSCSADIFSYSLLLSSVSAILSVLLSQNFTHRVFIWWGYCPLSFGLRLPVHSTPPAGPSHTKPEAFRDTPHSLSRI